MLSDDWKIVSFSGLTCPQRPSKPIQPYCNPDRVRTFDLGSNKILVAWIFPPIGDSFPDAPVKSYALNYGKIKDKTKPLFEQVIEASEVQTVKGEQTYAIISGQFNCEDVYRIQVSFNKAKQLMPMYRALVVRRLPKSPYMNSQAFKANVWDSPGL